MVTLSFNQGLYLREAVESVLAQELCPYVLVDPGSEDGSRELIGSYLPRLKGCVLEPDEGPADGLNKGFELLDTPVLGYLNGDDRLAPGALAFVSQFFDHHAETDVLCGAIGIIDERGNRALRRRTPDVFDLRKYAYEICNVWQMATFPKRCL
jgi:glycosyltransferase involved in cell wall biosynthesis